MTNFDYLKADPQLEIFADAAIAAEKIYSIDPGACVLNCRRAMEYAVKWMYSVDDELTMPADTTLVSLLSDADFRAVFSNTDLLRRMDFIRKKGNDAAHDDKGRKITPEIALHCLENLFYLTDFIFYCYSTSEDYDLQRTFDPSLPEAQTSPAAPAVPVISEEELQKILDENAALKDFKAKMTAHREQQQQTYTPHPLAPSEYKTRKLYIDTMLTDAGWVEGKNWLNEVPVTGMTVNKTGTGYVDYVLFGDNGRPLALIEAKKTCVDPAAARQQAKEYADCLQKQYGVRPVIFLTNGFDTRIVDGQYPERSVAAIYAKRDLEKLFNLRAMRQPLDSITVNENIAGRYYQIRAVKAVCESFGKGNRRKALLVMATGSGKTRTVISLCDVLLRCGWVRNILFLADRTTLVTQAKRSFVNLLENLSVTNLCEDKENPTAHCVFSTYQTMMNCIDSVQDNEDGSRIFTCGHFDLVICDEAHRSIYNTYRDIFTYFDAPLVGLTATPKDEVDKNTYEIFELQNCNPTDNYPLAQAVEDHYLVDFTPVSVSTKFLEEGLRYDQLSDEEKAEYEATFADEDGNIPESIGSSAFNQWIFNRDTVVKVLDTLMTQGLRIDYGENLGKTIIFARNHRHAEFILEIFNQEYPYLPGYAMVIDNKLKFAQKAIDDFADPKKKPQIAISVDMLDTGVDVPEILNLVFFKKVMSKAKFWQMIGRGTRLCPGLMDGADKDGFYIFDFCNNFAFFNMSDGKPTPMMIAVQSAVFRLKAQIVWKLQELEYQTDELIAFRRALVDDLLHKVQELPRENFAVRQHLQYVEQYSNPQVYDALTYDDILLMEGELAHLILPDGDHPKAVRFDALLYGMELAMLSGKSNSRRRTDLRKKAQALSEIASIPEIAAQSELLDQLLHTDYTERADIHDFEHIRKALRDLIKYIHTDRPLFITNFTDDITEMDWHESELTEDDLPNYRARAEHYIRTHQDNPAIVKLRENIPLGDSDIAELEKILWSEAGSREDYESTCGQKPLGEFVREIVGLDFRAAKEAFSAYLNDVSLDSRQIYFVQQIIEYIVRNGLMKDLSVLQDSPFTDCGSVSEVFGSNPAVWQGIRSIIGSVNANALRAGA